MPTSGLSDVISGGTQYDFTSMTRKQALAAGGELFKEGKLNEQELGYLIGFSCDSMPVHPGAPDAPGYGLDSPLKRNYQLLIQQDLAENEYLGSSQQKEIATDKDLLKVLAPYFSPQTATSAVPQTQESAVDLLG